LPHHKGGDYDIMMLLVMTYSGIEAV
jgi:hypothetical protein